MSSSLSLPVPLRAALQPLWVQHLAADLRGLALARETNGILLWAKNSWLYLLNQAGQRQAQVQTSEALAGACCADDGSAYVALGGNGDIWWLAPDLTLRWRRSLAHRGVAAALDPFGQYLAVADSRGNLHLFDRHGRQLFQVANPRPLHYLAFVPAAPLLVGCADYGLVAGFEPTTGHCLWRDGLVAHVGALTVNGDGEQILLACYTEGLQRYNQTGRNQGRVSVGEPCYLAALSFEGHLTLAASLSSRLLLLDRTWQTLCTYPLDKPAVDLALTALGDAAVVALADGRVLGFEVQTTAPA